ncbi:hypothetical protein D3C81_1689170 [compost metagenome]
MRQQNRIIQRRQRMMVRKRLLHVHVQSCRPDRSAAQRLDQRLFVDGRSSRSVDENGGLLHQLKLALADHPPGLRRQWRHEAHKIRLGQELVQCAVGRAILFLQLRIAGTVMVNDFHIEAEPGALNDFFTNAAKSDDAERLIVHLM